MDIIIVCMNPNKKNKTIKTLCLLDTFKIKAIHKK